MSAKERVLAGIATINADPNIVNKGQAVEQFVQQNYPEQWEKMKQMTVDRANNPTQAESMQRMNSQQPPSGAFGGDSLPGVMQTQPRNIFRNMRDGRVMSGPTPISPPGSVVETPYQPLGSNPTVTARADPNYTQRQMIQQSGQGMRQTPDPRAVPQPAPTIFDSIGSGLKSAGRGMGQYAEKLFNDPNRMAMLQGGLSMMNPNSYYDQQGFGSVFQGLETGLGQAQKGMKGVLDRRALSAKTALDKLGGKKTYKTFTETNTQGNPVKINYELDGRGGRKEISRSDITKLVSGVNDKGELSVQQFNVTTGALKDVVVKKGIDPIQAQKYLSLIDQVEDWDEALKKYPYSASEIPGKGFDMVNLIVESFFRETPIEGRAKIETMKAQLKPLITPEILKDSRISQAEWEMIDAFLGNGMLSSGLQKERAVPAILKLLRIGGGIQGSVGGTGGGTDFEKKHPDLAGKM